MAGVVYDAGALLAAERDDRRFLARHRQFLQRDARLLVPAPVLAQVWRGVGRQVGLARALQGCEVVATDGAAARRAGLILAGTRTSDVVDAIVVVTAERERATTVVTSDPDDLQRLLLEIDGAPPDLLTV